MARLSSDGFILYAAIGIAVTIIGFTVITVDAASKAKVARGLLSKINKGNKADILATLNEDPNIDLPASLTTKLSRNKKLRLSDLLRLDPSLLSSIAEVMGIDSTGGTGKSGGGLLSGIKEKLGGGLGGLGGIDAGGLGTLAEKLLGGNPFAKATTTTTTTPATTTTTTTTAQPTASPTVRPTDDYDVIGGDGDGDLGFGTETAPQTPEPEVTTTEMAPTTTTTVAGTTKAGNPGPTTADPWGDWPVDETDWGDEGFEETDWDEFV